MPLNPETVTQQLELLTSYRRTLAHLLQQAAQYGGEAFALPQTANGIAIARAEIPRIKTALREHGVSVDDDPNDELPEQPKIVSPDRAADDHVGIHGDTTINTGGGNFILTEGGDYAGRDLDKRTGSFVSGGTIQDSVIIGVNQGPINMTIQPSQLESLLASLLIPTAGQANIPQLLTVLTMPPPDNAPLPPDPYAFRRTAVQQLLDSFANVIWLAIVDGPGKGKTQLAYALTVTEKTRHMWWISLRGRDAAEAHLHLERQLVRWLVQLKADNNFWTQYIGGRLRLPEIAALVATTAGETGLVVVDDIPDPLQNTILFDSLIMIAAAFASSKTKIVTTGQRDLPPTLEVQLGAKLRTTASPPFSYDDVSELLEQAGAPAAIRRDSIIALILADTQGLPSLVGASVDWLRRRQWQFRAEEFTALLIGTPTEPIRELARRQLLRLLDDTPRELLYRLSLLQTEFDKVVASKVAAVEPSIDRTGECVDELAGPWLERKPYRLYAVSPLLKGAGQYNLTEEVQRQIHKVVANNYLQKRVIDASQAHVVCLHLFKAQEYELYATILIRLLIQAETQAQAKYIAWATHVLTRDVQWPVGLGTRFRIMLRAAQVRTRILAGEDASDLDADLEQLIAQAGPEEAEAVFFAYINTGPMLNETSADIGLQRAIRALRLQRTHQIISEDLLPAKIEEVILFPIVRMKTPTQLQQVLSELRKMSDMERSRLFEVSLAVEAFPRLIDATTWMYEADETPEKQNWPKILGLLNDIRQVGSLPGAQLLLFAEARARAIVLADYLKQAEEAVDLLDDMPLASNDELNFLINYTAGCIWFDADRIEEAFSRFGMVPALETDAFSFYKLDTKRRLAILYGKLGRWDEARLRCIEIIHSNAKLFELLPYDKLEMLGELAWVHWSTGNKLKACSALSGLINSLVMQGDEVDSRFREVFNKTGHALGWFVAMAAVGHPLSTTSTGEPYTSMHPGFFGIRRERLSSYRSPSGFSKTLLLTQLGLLAGQLGLYGMAWRAYTTASTFLQLDGEQWLWGSADVGFASLAVRFSQPQEALTLGLRAIKAVAVAKKLYDKGDRTITRHVDVQSIWEALDEAERRKAERQLLHITFGPVITKLLSDDPSSDRVDATIAFWEQAVNTCHDAFEEPIYWDQAIRRLRLLVNAWQGEPVSEQDLDISDDETILKILWYFIASTQQDRHLVDSLQMQVTALCSFLEISYSGQYMILDIGKIIHRFWLRVAQQRSFALISPSLFRQDLLKIIPTKNTKSAITILRLAARAVGVGLPDNVSTRFRQAEAFS